MNLNPETEEYLLNDLLIWRDPDAYALLEKVARQHEIKVEALAKLLVWMRKVQLKENKHGGLKKELDDDIFTNDSLWER